MSHRDVHYVPSWTRKSPCLPPKRSKLVLCEGKHGSGSDTPGEKTGERIRHSASKSDLSQNEFDLRNAPVYSWDDMALRMLAPLPAEHVRQRNEIPFHIPHKRILQKLNIIVPETEPLPGYLDIQNRRRRPKTPTPERIESDENLGVKIKEKDSVKRKKPPDDLIDVNEIIDQMRKSESFHFLYLIYGVPRTSEFFSPYSFKIVPFEQLDKKHFITISTCGVMLNSPGDITFTSLDEWENEYESFRKITQIRVFKLFRMWKAFYLWKKEVSWRKYTESRLKLALNLFILNPILKDSLLEIKQMCVKLENISYPDLSRVVNFHLFEFIELQMCRQEQIQEKLNEFRDIVKHLVNTACNGALIFEGYTTDDSSVRLSQCGLNQRRQKDGVLRMSYTEQANKRRVCERLSNFINLVDYLMMEVYHRCIYNSLQALHDVFEKHLMFLPTEEMLTRKDPKVNLDLPRPDGYPQQPFFFIDVFADINGLITDPSEEVFINTFQELIEMYNQNVKNLSVLVQDPLFSPFIEPIVNEKHMERLIGEGPSIEILISIDPNVHSLKTKIIEHLKKNFIHAELYIRRLDSIQRFYGENCALKHEVVLQEKSPKQMRYYLERYHSQIEEINNVRGKQSMGILTLLLEDFKTEVLPSPTELLRITEKVVPKLGSARVDALTKECTYAIEFLEIEPVTTIEYVRHLEFLDDITNRLDGIETEIDYAKEIYDLVEEFQVPTPQDEIEAYFNFGSILTQLRNICDKKVLDRTNIINKLNVQLSKDISTLIKEVGIIQDESIVSSFNRFPLLTDINEGIDKILSRTAEEERQLLADGLVMNNSQELLHMLFLHTRRKLSQFFKDFSFALIHLHSQDWLIQKNSNPDNCKFTLNIIAEQLAECHKRAQEIKGYQKQFRIEMTRFEMLEEVINDVKLRQMLWESLDVWKKAYEEFMYGEFNTLNPEDVNIFVAKILKNIAQLDKGIPKNDITPDFKEEVERFKEKIPVIANLRNPTLKARHWLAIEAVLNHKFVPGETLTLKQLENLGVFNFMAELQEISAQASSEAGLENLLKKVEDNWKELEFPVISYRDTKDVFILGSLEEVQQILDDSFINVNTILSSRHVGPIKGRVDEWYLLLELFSKTIEEWWTCQTNWLYLESIFSAPDIQRQLPNEAKMFIIVDKNWKDLMRRTAKNPLAMQTATYPGTLEMLQTNNNLLDQIMKCLEAYLESKRVIFPRFYFLSNEELLEILAQTRNPHAVQPFLRKCFDAIAKLEFGSVQGKGGAEAQLTSEIVAMLSPEGERVALGKGLKARGNVEDWLGKVEESMLVSLRKAMKFALSDHQQKERTVWVLCHASQIVLTVSQIMWCKSIHQILDGPGNRLAEMEEFEKLNFKELNRLAAMVRGNLSKLGRMVLCSLITIDVHARDNVSNLVKEKTVSSQDFEWLKCLRYYWEDSIDNCVARMSSAYYVYGYEYLGASPRLVITPLTDKCYLCLMGALQLDLGGAPAGPAGTGKTETTKDLAKSLAIQCVVFNCSEGLDFKMMGRFFAGLAQSGAWCCFDEFNRIDIEVLSVIAQQLITIRNAKAAKLTRFMFEGREIKLVPQCAAFITMNPGYAGRTELPDNLKALFRPMAMMVPDYALIAEVILYSEGFESSKILAHKMTQMYKLCSEQLSQQDHYDFGMRAVKSVLVMAGSLKRENPDKREDVVLIRALRDSNLPKFLSDDALLFQGILSDLFPGVMLPEQDYGHLLRAIVTVMKDSGLQPEECMIRKVIQLYETMLVRHGVMLVGPTGGGKTTVLNALKNALTHLYEEKVENPYYRPVQTYVLNPKSITLGELYGEVNLMTLEWKDGVLGMAVRTAVQCTRDDHQWVVCDGPVDAVWIENMNTVLDDNKMLCLANSERIKLTPYVHMVFEVMDLAQASPATVSRCGMVYIDPDELRWMPYVKTWISRLPSSTGLIEEYQKYLLSLFDTFVDDCLYYLKKNCSFGIHQVDISKVITMCKLLESMFLEPNAIEKGLDKSKIRTFMTQCFVFCLVWALGGNMNEQHRDAYEVFLRSLFEEHEDAKLSTAADLWSLYIDVKNKRMDFWTKIIPNFLYDPDVPFFEILVPTQDTVRFGYLMAKLLNVNQAILFTGNTGVGKSVIAKSVLNMLTQTGLWVPIILNFSAQTSSARTQEMIEIKLEKKKRTLLGAPVGKKVVVFVDDVNMPKLDTYGSQPPIELLRQYLDFGGLYDREKLFWKDIQDVVVSAACAPPGGGRNPVTPRFMRHFSIFMIPFPSESSLKTIFKAIMSGFLSGFVSSIKDLAGPIVNAATEIYQRIATDLLPTPAKSHYVFNLRDLSKCVQGTLQADPGTVRENIQIMRLFYHECLRVFHDRLINKEDKSYFYFLMREICSRQFGTPVLFFEDEPVLLNPPVLIFGDFMNPSAPKEDRIYEEIKSIDKLKIVLQDYLEDYNLVTSKDMKIIFFMDAVEHCSRLARILRAERGNGLLVGVGGMGKQSLTKLASHLNGYKCFQIELTRNYDHSSFHDDLRKLYFSAGAKGVNTAFLFSDSQIVQEEFLEDINNILNSGEVPNLFESDEYEKVINAVRPFAREYGIAEGNRDQIFNLFISRVRGNLHVVLCMSPVGDAFRRRCRMFPSLVNCCTIDWFLPWPTEALLSVAEDAFKNTVSNEVLIQKLSLNCVTMHESVEVMTYRLLTEKRKYYYTTPSSYLELLKLFKKMLSNKTDDTFKLRARIANGLKKLNETNTLVDKMKIELIAFEPQLQAKSEATAALMKHLAKEQAAADQVRQIVLADEAIAKEKAAETQELADDAQRDLAEAMPAMEAAMKALESLNKNDINELKVFNKPPELVKVVMEAVCLLLGVKQDWASAKIVLADVNFLKKLQEFDKDHISDSILKTLRTKYINNPDFIPDKVATQSKVCKSLCMWVRAIDVYAKVFKVVEPKRKALEGAERELNAIMSVLRDKQKKLSEVEAQIANLEAMFDASVAEKAALEGTMALTTARLGRSGRLTSALADEQIRWEQQVQMFTMQLENMVGDVLLGAGCVAYEGAFTSDFREELVQIWLNKCFELGIPASKNFSLITVLADPYEIRMWNTFGLPRDNISTENAILVTKSERWPLMIDPQEQANRWVRNMEAGNGLKICKLTDSNFLRVLESCIRTGMPALLEEVGETLDPTLGPILLRETFIQGGRPMIRLGDSDIEYDPNFKLYMTTKLANPHYLPEICILVTLVNFTVTPSGLEDQLLADVVRLERPDLEKTRTELITRINNDKQQLKTIEDKILKLLFASTGNILDDEELIDTLNESKETTEVIATRLQETEATEEKISVARNRYRVIALRGSVLFFVVTQLGEIDPMYQFSLKYFNQLFNNVIEGTEKVKDLEQRLQILIDEITVAVYTNISRGLFERHKLVFSFMLCISILKQKGLINDSYWSFILRGIPSGHKVEVEKKPEHPALTDVIWNNANYLAQTFDSFRDLEKDVLSKIRLQLGDYDHTININVENKVENKKDWNKTLTEFEKLVIFKALREEKLIFAITEYVRTNLGKTFVESPQINLHQLYLDTSNVTPLIFILSTGSDPFGAFQRFAAEKGCLEKIHSISLGQGQGPVAEKMIRDAVLVGDWIFLQNCHLATSWMLPMERKIISIAENPDKVHADFRIFLSSMPSKTFPVAVLQNSVKVTNEPPKGLRANIKRAFFEMSRDFFEDNVLQSNWRKMVFGLCFFHAIIQERKKFGSLGWNITYEFNDSDRECALNNLKMFCTEGTIPWDALEYITGEITYGGRVTDGWDQRCLKTILKSYFSPPTLAPGYKYSASGTYFSPESLACSNLQDYRDFIENLPLIEEPEIFGMHENANIAFQIKETHSVILTILNVQPREGGGGGGRTTDDIAYDLAESIGERIILKIDPDKALPILIRRDTRGRLPSLTTVLFQEVDRFNKLLRVLHVSLTNLKKAIKGLLVMSDQLEEIYKAFINNTVPKMWEKVAYPSLKSLGSWIRDLELRLDFVKTWVLSDHPVSYWISGFFFPQGFLTGVLQTHARRYDTPIDQVKFDFIIKNEAVDQEEIFKGHESSGKEINNLYGNLSPPNDGVLIHGLFLDAARWDYMNMLLSDPYPGEMNPPLPVIHLNPQVKPPSSKNRYVCPLYKTSIRAGVLSTTGHSTNFVVPVLLPTDRDESVWIIKGTALLTQITD